MNPCTSRFQCHPVSMYHPVSPCKFMQRPLDKHNIQQNQATLSIWNFSFLLSFQHFMQLVAAQTSDSATLSYHQNMIWKSNIPLGHAGAQSESTDIPEKNQKKSTKLEHLLAIRESFITAVLLASSSRAEFNPEYNTTGSTVIRQKTASHFTPNSRFSLTLKG